MFGYDAGDDEGLLTMKWIGVAKVDAKNTQEGLFNNMLGTSLLILG